MSTETIIKPATEDDVRQLLLDKARDKLQLGAIDQATHLIASYVSITPRHPAFLDSAAARKETP